MRSNVGDKSQILKYFFYLYYVHIGSERCYRYYIQSNCNRYIMGVSSSFTGYDLKRSVTYQQKEKKNSGNFKVNNFSLQNNFAMHSFIAKLSIENNL